MIYLALACKSLLYALYANSNGTNYAEHHCRLINAFGIRWLYGLIPLISKTPSTTSEQPGLILNLSAIQKTVFLATRLINELRVRVYDSPNFMILNQIFEPRHEKTNVLHMRKQRRRSASW